MDNTSKRDRGGEEPPVGVKRARTSLDQEESKTNASEAVRHVSYKRLKNVPLPDEISALPHILNLLDMLLMTPEEALSVAIEANDLKWVQQILDRFCCDYSEAMAQAAGLNRLDVVNLIISDIFTGSGESSMALDGIELRFDSDFMLLIMEKGTLSAARNGHVAIVKRLLPMTIDQARNSTNFLLYWFDEVQKVMDEGAVNGQLSVVEFMVEHASTDHYRDRYSRWTSDDTLTKSILAGQIEVAEFLVNESDISWNLKDAFIAALDKGEVSLAERIRELYPQQMRGQILFINVACSGDVNAVEYLYKNGCNDSVLVERSFTLAASEGQNEVVEFLAGTGRVSSEAFGQAFERACFGYKPECIGTVIFLNKLNRASRQCIDRGFELANSFAVVKFLFENGEISNKAITAKFDSAVRFHQDIILHLYKHQCIPPNLIAKAFLEAVKSLNADHLNAETDSMKAQVVKCLRDDERLTPNTLGEAFLYAVQNDKKEMMLLLYDERRTPPEFLVKAFVEVVHHKHTELVTEILKLLSTEEHVPQKFMHETFVAAARHGQMWAMKHVCESLTADLPLEVLKNGIDVAGNDRIEKFIRKMMYDQVSKEHA